MSRPGVGLDSGNAGFLTRMFLRDCAFLMWLYGRADSRAIWSYGVFGFSITLGAFAMLVFYAAATFFPALVPSAIHPVTASKEILTIEAVVIYLGVGWWIDHRFSGLRDNVVLLASRYCTRSDRLKWCLTTLLGVGSIVGIVLLVIAMHR